MTGPAPNTTHTVALGATTDDRADAQHGVESRAMTVESWPIIDNGATSFTSNTVQKTGCGTDEITGYAELKTQAQGKLGIKDDTGKPLIARYIAKQLANKTPVEVPLSIRKVIEQAIKVTWQCSCLSTP